MTGPDQGFPRLLGDVGGTSARWAWQAGAGAPLSRVRRLASADFDTIGACIAHYLHGEGLPGPRSVGFGIATAITGDLVSMTNHPWRFSIAALQATLGADRLLVLNDFEALAEALPALGDDDRRAVGGGHATADGNLALIGPGTGLGVSGLLAGRGGDRLAVVGEGGHASLAPATAREANLLAVLRERFDHVSAERALSGPGLVNLYLAVCALERASPLELTPADVAERAFERQAEHGLYCHEALSSFASLLGNAAGNLALTLGARGGVYIGGGIVPRLGARFDTLPFRSRFEDKGRLRSYLQPIPTWVITAQTPALRGVARALDRASR